MLQENGQAQVVPQEVADAMPIFWEGIKIKLVSGSFCINCVGVYSDKACDSLPSCTESDDFDQIWVEDK